jgi:peptidoglycan/xylan/chitin deacetylase (PgdA/CDA1 family)
MNDRADTLRKLIMNVARYSGGATLARPFMGGIGAILMLHRVNGTLPKPLGINGHLTVTPGFLDDTIVAMKRMGYVFVDMDGAVERIGSGVAGPRFAALTADDGYRDNLTDALPVLERHSVPLTVYVAPGLVEGTADLWWDVLEDAASMAGRLQVEVGGRRLEFDCRTEAAKRDAVARLTAHLTCELPEEKQRGVLRAIAGAAGVDADRQRRDSIMDWDEIRTLARHPLVSIGAHTVHHYNLKRLAEQSARAELENSAARIAAEIGERPRHMAFPYGYEEAVGPREVALAREAGYVSAVTTRHGVIQPGHAGHLCALPRISLNGRFQSVGYVRAMLSGVTTPLANGGRRLVTV